MPGNVKPSSFTAGQRVPTSLSALGALVREADGSGASLAGSTDVQPGTALHLAQIRVTRATTSSVETRTPVSAALLNQRGTVQGGVYSVIADATAGWATEAFLGNDAYTTTAVTSQLVGAAVQGDVLVTHAHIVHGGRRMIVASAEVYCQRPGADDRLVALVTCQQLVLEPS